MKRSLSLILLCSGLLVLSSLGAQSTQTPMVERLKTLLDAQDFQGVLDTITTLERSPDYLESYYAGYAAFKINLDDLAMEYLKRSTSLKPDFYPAFDYLGAVNYYNSHYPEAKAAYLRCTELAPEEYRPYFMLGLIYEELTQIKDAEIAYRTALNYKPEYSMANYRLGYLLFLQDQLVDAAAYISTSLSLEPSNYAAASVLTEIHYKLNNRPAFETIKQTLRSIQANSADPRIKELKYFQFDEYQYKNYHIIAKEIFVPQGDLYYYWIYYIFDQTDALVKTINLESSAGLRELGTQYIIGTDRYQDDKRIHVTTPLSYKTLPDYAEMRARVQQDLDTGLPTGATGTYKK